MLPSAAECFSRLSVRDIDEHRHDDAAEVKERALRQEELQQEQAKLRQCVRRAQHTPPRTAPPPPSPAARTLCLSLPPSLASHLSRHSLSSFGRWRPRLRPPPSPQL